MRHDPLFLLWSVHCPSPEISSRLKQRLPLELQLDTSIVDEVRPAAENGEVHRQSHRLGDYFESIRVMPGTVADGGCFRVLFHRRANAGRFWKDVMARVLQKIRTEAAPAKTTLEFAGDEEPKVIELPR